MTKRNIPTVPAVDPEPASELEYEQILLPPKVAAAIAEVIAYLWDAERRDYFDRTEEEREGHIFPKLLRVRHWGFFPVAQLRFPSTE